MLRWLMLLLSLLTLVIGAFLSATDGQGALVFVVFVPLILAFLTIAYFSAERNKAPLAKRTALTGAIFIVLFTFSAVTPWTRAVPELLIGGVAQTFQWFTGESPYDWARRRNDVRGMMERLVAQAEGKKVLDLSLLAPARPWDRVCVFGPYTGNEVVKNVIGRRDFILSMYMDLASSDSICGLVFLDGSAISHVVSFPRSLWDFSGAAGRCYSPAEAQFVR